MSAPRRRLLLHAAALAAPALLTSRTSRAAVGRTDRLDFVHAHTGESLSVGWRIDGQTSADALRWGLINQVVPDGTVVDAALALAERITSNAPLAVQASKRIAAGIDDGTITADEAGWSRTMREIGTLMKSEDAKEGPLAFAEKRAPGFDRW